jgi:hypothetical protein
VFHLATSCASQQAKDMESSEQATPDQGKSGAPGKHLGWCKSRNLSYYYYYYYRTAQKS